MPFNLANPRESLGLSDDFLPGQALVQIDHPNERLREQYQKYGFITLTNLQYGLTTMPEVPRVICKLDPDSPYYTALGIIFDAEEVGEFTIGSHQNALDALVNGVFDSTEWVEYLPAAAQNG